MVYEQIPRGIDSISDTPALPQYRWMVIVGAFAALIFGWGTGSNDVANAFGTSVGSGALTLKQAVIVAVICEFTGALLLGRVTASTIAGGIADIKVFQSNWDGPACYAYGMMWVLILGGLWQGWASWAGFNVSATHSIIGGILGFSLAYNANGVLWAVYDGTKIPPYGGIVPIVVAWFFAPIATGIAATVIFMITRKLVLRSENSYQRAFLVLPVVMAFVTWVNVFFVFTKGAAKTFQEQNGGVEWTTTTSGWVALLIAFALGVGVFFSTPFIKRWAEKWQAYEEQHKKELEERQANPDMEVPKQSMVEKIMDKNQGMDWMEDLDAKVMEMHAKAEKFDPMTEKIFGFLQVWSACCVMFAHGAGEVGYMTGPYTVIINVYNTNTLSKNVACPFWVVVLCAGGLVVGLATYGQNLIKAMGKQMCKITPSRGFAAEVSTAMVIMVAQQYALPTSSSQCITGGIVGIGMAEGLGGVNWRYFFGTFMSWIFTLICMGLGSAMMFQQGHSAP